MKHVVTQFNTEIKRRQMQTYGAIRVPNFILVSQTETLKNYVQRIHRGQR